MEYELNIDGVTKIEANNPQIISMVDIKIYQHDKSANDRSDQLFADLTIQGVLDNRSKEQTKAMFDWSLKTDDDSVYKNVQIRVFDRKKVIRDYTLEDMFCASYREIIDEYVSQEQNDSVGLGRPIGSFVLEMKQRRGAAESIKVGTN